VKQIKLRNAFYGAIGAASGCAISSFTLHHGLPLWLVIEQAIYVGMGSGVALFLVVGGLKLMDRRSGGSPQI
jgi:hypothetical protein